ncbi:MAG: hypothetical protein HY929_01425, partial [Euryarchaeota archaeon]|nr:hypothetical protein [Euryarchaeota archaeon]
TYSIWVISLAILSLILIYFASFLASSIATNIKSESILMDLVSNIAFLIIIFGVVQAVYIAVSYLITLPIAAHAVPELYRGTSMTVMGYIGFGGGNVLRFIFGALGFFTTILINDIKNIQNINWKLIPPTLFCLILALLLPIVGPILSDIFLVAAMGEIAQTGTEVSNTLASLQKPFLVFFTTQEGMISRGILMYFFAGLAIFATKYLHKNSRTVALVLASFFWARGLTRVGNLNPAQFISSILPGVFFGLAIFIIILGIENVLKFLRKTV